MSNFTPPPYIGENNRTTFDRIVKELIDAKRDIEQLDMDVIGVLAVNIDLFTSSAIEIFRDGAFIRSGNVIKKNPACDLLKDTQLAIRFGTNSLGMSPEARLKMQITSLPTNVNAIGAFDDELNAQ